MTAAEKQAKTTNWLLALASSLLLLLVVGLWNGQGRMATMEANVSNIFKRLGQMRDWMQRMDDKIDKIQDKIK